MMFLENLVSGAITGAIAASLGYAKNKGKKFEPISFTSTVLLGVAVGAFASAYNIPYDTAEMYLASIGALTLLGYGTKAIARRLVPWLKSLF